jgi:hypothetical protein
MTFRAEDRIQAAVCAHLRWRGSKGVVWFAVPNGGYRTPIEAHVLKTTGVRPGVSDLILIHGGKVHALELKTDKGRATTAQIEFVDEVRAAGGEAWIAHGLNEAIEVLENWGLLRKDYSHRRDSVYQLAV